MVAEADEDLTALHNKRWTPQRGQLQLAWAFVWGDLSGHILANTDDSVQQRQGSATAVAVLGLPGRPVCTRPCHPPQP